MEEIINKLIEMDNTAKNKINNLQEKEDNIETYINERLKREKKIIDNKYIYKIKKIQEKYDLTYEQKIKELEEKKEKDIIKLKEKYEKEKNIILQNLLNSII